MSLWSAASASGILIIATGKHGYFVWQAFDTDQRFLILKTIFSLNLRLLIVSMVRHVLCGDSPLIQNKNIDFKTKFLFGISLGKRM